MRMTYLTESTPCYTSERHRSLSRLHARFMVCGVSYREGRVRMKGRLVGGMFGQGEATFGGTALWLRPRNVLLCVSPR
jgi:hypothetical protein